MFSHSNSPHIITFFVDVHISPAWKQENTRHLLQTVLLPHPHVREHARPGEDGGSHQGEYWEVPRQNDDDSGAICNPWEEPSCHSGHLPELCCQMGSSYLTMDGASLWRCGRGRTRQRGPPTTSICSGSLNIKFVGKWSNHEEFLKWKYFQIYLVWSRPSSFSAWRLPKRQVWNVGHSLVVLVQIKWSMVEFTCGVKTLYGPQTQVPSERCSRH